MKTLIALLIALASTSIQAAQHDNTLLSEPAENLTQLPHLGAGVYINKFNLLLSLVCIDDQNLMKGSAVGCNRVRFAIHGNGSSWKDQFIGPYINIVGLSQKQAEKKIHEFLEDQYHVDKDIEWIWEKKNNAQSLKVRNSLMNQGFFKNRGWNWSLNPWHASREQFYQIKKSILRERSGGYDYSPYLIFEELQEHMKKISSNSRYAFAFKTNFNTLVQNPISPIDRQGEDSAFIDLQFWTRLSDAEQVALLVTLSFDRSFYQNVKFVKFLNELGVENAAEIAKNAQALQDDNHMERIFTRFQ